MLNVSKLSVSFYSRNGVTKAVDDVSFQLNKGETLGIVGESGSGKSVTCYSLLGLIPCPPGKIENGRAEYHGDDLLAMSESQLSRIRGAKISMIFQDPMTSLNPYMTIGDQIIEAVLLHQNLNKAAARNKAVQALEEVGIESAEFRLNSYPHEFSGGMRQRVMIAMALATEPEILIADEPTTALDVTIQAQILDLLAKIKHSRNISIIFISHDLGVIRNIADRVLVMKDGRIVEQGQPLQIFESPTHSYTKQLIAAIPNSAKPWSHQANLKDPIIVDIKSLKTTFELNNGPFWSRKIQEVKAVDDVSLSINRGEILGLVGESGSGKSTLGRSLIRLIEAQSGEILFNGKAIRDLSTSQLRTARREFQMIFQDPYASLNPRMTVFDTLAEPMILHKLCEKKELEAKVNALMDDVGLERKAIRKYPHEFSGGQRQRIAIARAIASEPQFIVADEPVSALDVTIQAQILDLLLNLSKDRNLSMLFISHDLSVVRYICDRVVVMRAGQIVEIGECEEVFNSPKDAYTQKLLAAIPS